MDQLEKHLRNISSSLLNIDKTLSRQNKDNKNKLKDEEIEELNQGKVKQDLMMEVLLHIRKISEANVDDFTKVKAITNALKKVI